MTCYKCHHEFCWICGGNWKNHSACNQYKKENNEKEASRSALERYLHYFHRYNVHEQSKKLEQNLRATTLTKMVDLQEEKSSRWIDVQFLEAATEQLIECRRTLKYTYVYAYYLPDGPEKTLFEYLQAQLETETESLSGTLEKTSDMADKKRVVDVTMLAGKRLNNLVEGVKGGLVPDSSNKSINKKDNSSSSTSSIASTVFEKVLGNSKENSKKKGNKEQQTNRFWN